MARDKSNTEVKVGAFTIDDVYVNELYEFQFEETDSINSASTMRKKEFYRTSAIS